MLETTHTVDNWSTKRATALLRALGHSQALESQKLDLQGFSLQEWQYENADNHHRRQNVEYSSIPPRWPVNFWDPIFLWMVELMSRTYASAYW